MRKMYFFSLLLSGCIACDSFDEAAVEDDLDLLADAADADGPQPRVLGEIEQGLDPGTTLSLIPLDAPEELEMEESNWSEFGLSDASQPVAGPAGKTCCVNCADGWSGWWNRGTGDACNKHGANWCHDHNWNFLNAEWFTKCPAG